MPGNARTSRIAGLTTGARLRSPRHFPLPEDTDEIIRYLDLVPPELDEADKLMRVSLLWQADVLRHDNDGETA